MEEITKRRLERQKQREAQLKADEEEANKLRQLKEKRLKEREQKIKQEEERIKQQRNILRKEREERASILLSNDEERIKAVIELQNKLPELVNNNNKDDLTEKWKQRELRIFAKQEMEKTLEKRKGKERIVDHDTELERKAERMKEIKDKKTKENISSPQPIESLVTNNVEINDESKSNNISHSYYKTCTSSFNDKLEKDKFTIDHKYNNNNKSQNKMTALALFGTSPLITDTSSTKQCAQLTLGANAYKMSYEHFLSDYWILKSNLTIEEVDDALQTCSTRGKDSKYLVEQIVQFLKERQFRLEENLSLDFSCLEFGEERLFMPREMVIEFEKLKEKTIRELFTLVQASIRAFLARQQYALNNKNKK